MLSCIKRYLALATTGKENLAIPCQFAGCFLPRLNIATGQKTLTLGFVLLVNPDSVIRPEIEAKLRRYRKFASVWAKKLHEARLVETLEGTETADAGDYLCRGIAGELWPQSKASLWAKYDSTDEFDKDDWQKFEPKPSSPPVLAAQLEFPFSVTSPRGELQGKPGDYVAVSSTDRTDIWIVDQRIFEASYEIFSTD